jgi:hypothetical protein
LAQTGRTAQEVAASVGPNNQVNDDAAAAAEAAGVSSAAFIDYEAGLAAYESRSDVENMATRLTREVGPDFDAAHWARQSGVFATGAQTYVDNAPTGSSGPEDVSVGEGPVDTWPPA